MARRNATKIETLGLCVVPAGIYRTHSLSTPPHYALRYLCNLIFLLSHLVPCFPHFCTPFGESLIIPCVFRCPPRTVLYDFRHRLSIILFHLFLKGRMSCCGTEFIVYRYRDKNDLLFATLIGCNESAREIARVYHCGRHRQTVCNRFGSYGLANDICWFPVREFFHRCRSRDMRQVCSARHA